MLHLSKIAVLALAGVAIAHPGEHHNTLHMKREVSARDQAARYGAKSLAACSDSLDARSLEERSVKRRAATVERLRQKRNIANGHKTSKRALADIQSWDAVNHNMSAVYNFDQSTSIDTIFGANTSCILAPEVTDGPYYIAGEYLRSNVKEASNSDGVDLFLEVQYIDTNTCKPVPKVAVDVWNANATGVYSGISVAGNYAEDGVNSTFLRGVQITDRDGIVNFETIFPGHYDGRAVHTHLLSHINATVQCNGTVSVWDAAVAHIGQLFWPEDLRADVESTAPYTKNTQALTTNEEDMWSVLQADASYDPFPQYVYLGDAVTDGLFAWIQIGINASADYSTDEYYNIAGYLGADGGHATSGGSAMPGRGNGTMDGSSPPI